MGEEIMPRLIDPQSEEGQNLTTKYASKGKGSKKDIVKGKDRLVLEQEPSVKEAPRYKEHQGQHTEIRPGPDQDPGPESLAQFVGRSIAKWPGQVYSQARTGVGLSDILKTLGFSGNINPLNIMDPLGGLTSEGSPWKDRLEEANRNIPSLVTTPENAQQEKEQFLPQYMTQSRPGKAEEWAEYMTGELPFWLANGPKNIIRSLIGSAGTMAGSEAGGRAGQFVGEMTGNKRATEILKMMGSLGLGAAGGAGAHALYENRPSKVGAEMAREEEHGVYRKQQQKDTEAANRKFKQEEERLHGRKEDVTNEFSEKHQEATQRKRESDLAHAENLEQFEKEKHKQATDIDREKLKYDQTIAGAKNIYSPMYKEAEGLQSTGKHDASKLLDVTAEAIDSVEHGASPSVKAAVHNVVDDIYKQLGVENPYIEKEPGKKPLVIISTPEAPKPPKEPLLSTEQAKVFKMNINESRFSKDPGSHSSNMKILADGIADFIYANNSDEHNKIFRAAEDVAYEKSQMIKNRKDFRETKDIEKADIKSKKFSAKQGHMAKVTAEEHQKKIEQLESEHGQAIREINNDLSKNKAQNKAVVEDIGARTFEDHLSSKLGKENLNKKFDAWAQTGGAGTVGAAALATVLGYANVLTGGAVGALGIVGGKIGQEIKTGRRLFKEYPKLQKKWGKLVGDSFKMSVPQFIKRASILNQETEKATKEMGEYIIPPVKPRNYK